MQKKPLKKVSTHFKKLGIEGKYLNMVKAIYDKPTANIIFKGEKTESIAPKIRSKTRDVLSSGELRTCASQPCPT